MRLIKKMMNSPRFIPPRKLASYGSLQSKLGAWDSSKGVEKVSVLGQTA
jgi:hypothetical protein